MGIKKNKLLTCESVYWPGMNNDTENRIKNYSICIDFQQMQENEKK